MLKLVSLVSLAAAPESLPSIEAADVPRLNDDRYAISLFADAPDIRTPIGAAVDRQGRLFVLESHTIMPPKDYDGPTTDRIKIFVDEDHDGKPDRVVVFAEGLKSGMNLTITPDGVVYVASSRVVVRLVDTDGDGRADQRTEILRFQTSDTFPMGYLLAPVVGPDGWLYIACNEWYFPWRLVGTDGSQVEGWSGGDGVFRCRPDGTALQRVATGFWSPFAMVLDADGRLLLVDNDPVSRGPNRLVHVVTGADYGHRWLYGFGGNHPLNGWNGELPGTLPPLGAVGEAPAGLMACATGSFPSDFASSLLVSAWGSNAIERHELTWKGNSTEVNRSVWIQGASQFHPVAIAQDRSGTIYITDWVVNDYHSHGQGRIWRAAPKKDVRLESARLPTKMWELRQPQSKVEIQCTLQSTDPVERHAGTTALAHPRYANLATELANNPDPRLRLGALIAIRRSGRDEAIEFCRKFLRDRDEAVRYAAVVWAGQEQLIELRADFDCALTIEVPSQRLIEAWLGAVSVLKPEFVQLCRTTKNQATAEALPTTLPDSLTHPLLRDKSWPAHLRNSVVPWVENHANEGTELLFLELAVRAKAPLNIAAVRRLTDARHPSVGEQLTELALDSRRSTQLRCEAVATLARRGPVSTRLLPLLEDSNESLVIEVIDALRPSLSTPNVKDALQRISGLRTDGKLLRAQKEAMYVLQPEHESRPTSLTGWQRLLASGGNPARGARRFFSRQTTCSSCHAIHGFGSANGPDLSNVARSMDRSMIIGSVVHPSDYFAPEFQLHVLTTQSGKVHSGIVLSTGSDSTTLQLAEGAKRVIPAGEIESLTPLRKSMMPDRLETTLSIEALRDLVAFLSTLR